MNLSGRVIEVHSLLCPDFDQCVEDTDHMLMFCEVATQICSQIEIWLDITLPMLVNVAELLTWTGIVNMAVAKRKVLEVIILTVIWML